MSKRSPRRESAAAAAATTSLASKIWKVKMKKILTLHFLYLLVLRDPKRKLPYKLYKTTVIVVTATTCNVIISSSSSITPASIMVFSSISFILLLKYLSQKNLQLITVKLQLFIPPSFY
ncbi:hypothetical protein NC653_000217 [Populus alba x Populus x berolinensis]|uniref:Uncharacterized protein n=1 Tax=Populus alba x Populus x berolinensis TaxID=444605 RepID=A0AAD6RI49_9ROSI|nr:hypothetical protein NC653_000217 [Populus alba x Populus x berolinensis]